MLFEPSNLLVSLPTARAAYSDRTAWLLAKMSALAYEPFETNDELLGRLAGQLAALTDADTIRNVLARHQQALRAPGGVGFEKIGSELAIAGFEVVNCFNAGGTQAFLARRDTDRIAVLAFRGTEQNFEDIKTDLNARFYVVEGVRTHTGFHHAYQGIHEEIQAAVGKLAGYTLFITGHSLGGALALMAARALEHPNIAACYTYGSPKVGNSEFGDAIKPPIYRIVNAADVVPTVPPTWTFEVVSVVLRVAHGMLPMPGFVRSWIEGLVERYRGYRHHGDMRYLTMTDESGKSLRLISNPDLPDRILAWWASMLTDRKSTFRDHSIARYCEKLERHALVRLDAQVPLPSVTAGTQPLPSSPVDAVRYLPQKPLLQADRQAPLVAAKSRPVERGAEKVQDGARNVRQTETH